MNTWRQLAGPRWRPFTVLAACILLLAALDAGQGAFLSAATAYSTLQIFATVSLVTLGLGLTMMIREFDLSVVGMYGMAGCIAVLTGTQHPWLAIRGNPQNRFARKSPSKGQKPANSIT